MITIRRVGEALGVFLWMIVPVSANDTTATLSAGGLEFAVNTDIVMDREDLYLSTKDVRVNYLFRNSSALDIHTRMAFPMPEVPFSPIDNVMLPQPNHNNFVGFTVKVDEQAIYPDLEVKAISAPINDSDTKPVFTRGIDITDAVRRAGLPVNAGLNSWKKRLQQIPESERKSLIKDGVLYDGDGDASPDGLSPQWSLRETYHWQQTFNAGKTVRIEHKYKPVSGMSFFTGDPSDMDTIGSTFSKRYCLDKAGLAGVRRLIDRAKLAASNGKNDSYVFATETEYVLSTGANWKGPIRNFHMTIDKIYPDAVMSTCVLGITKSKGTTFTLQRKNYTPSHDVRFVVFRFGEPG